MLLLLGLSQFAIGVGGPPAPEINPESCVGLLSRFSPERCWSSGALKRSRLLGSGFRGGCFRRLSSEWLGQHKLHSQAFIGLKSFQADDHPVLSTDRIGNMCPKKTVPPGEDVPQIPCLIPNLFRVMDTMHIRRDKIANAGFSIHSGREAFSCQKKLRKMPVSSARRTAPTGGAKIAAAAR